MINIVIDLLSIEPRSGEYGGATGKTFASDKTEHQTTISTPCPPMPGRWKLYRIIMEGWGGGGVHAETSGERLDY